MIFRILLLSFCLQFALASAGNPKRNSDPVLNYSSYSRGSKIQYRQVKKEQADSLNLLAQENYKESIDYLKKEELGLSFEHAKRMYELAKKNNNYVLEIKSLNLLSKIYEDEGDLKKSLTCLKKANSLKDFYLLGNEIGDVDDKNFPLTEEKTLELEKIKPVENKYFRFNELAIILSILLITILSLLTLSLYKINRLRAGINKSLKKKNKEFLEAKEKAEQANKIKENFLSNITHELRTPIYAITGLTYLMLEENPNKEQEEHLKSLKYSGEYLLSLINNILDLNKLSAKKVKKVKTDFQLRHRMNDFFASFKEVAKDENVDLHMKIDDAIPDNLSGDMLKICQVLTNLVSNAIKFSKGGDVWVNINLIRETKTAAVVGFEIVDNGIGIEKKYQKTIFKNFNQGEDETNIKFGGTGLGLPIVKNLLRFLDSKIYLESEKGVGSTFYFEISLEKLINLDTDKSKYIQENKSPLEEEMNQVFDGKKILVVDDNKLNQKITEKILKRKNITSELADNGKIALDLVAKSKYDLILMDIHMPVMDGIEATEIIRKKDSKTPIIALTAVSIDDKDQHFLHHGFTDIIPKPYKTELFFKKIYKVLKVAQQNQ